MSDDASAPITVLLGRWRDGDREAESQLIELLYPQLRRMAAAQSARQHGALTLAPTELANEAYLRFRDQQQVDWKNRDHLFAILATVLRRVLIDYLRERSAEKRGAGQVVVDIGGLGEHEHPSTPSHFEWLALEQALEKLEGLDPDVARVVELRLFAGLGPGEIASVTGSSVATVGRQWRFARSWLAAQLEIRDDESAG
jgi:RNA polymerase sigma factor (TIGR02999 family)